MTTKIGASSALLKDELAQLNGNVELLFNEIKNADEGTVEYSKFFKGYSDFRARVIMFNRNLNVLGPLNTLLNNPNGITLVNPIDIGDEAWNKVQNLKLEFNEWRNRFTDRGHSSEVAPLKPISPPAGIISAVPWWVWGGFVALAGWLFWPEPKRSHHKAD